VVVFEIFLWSHKNDHNSNTIFAFTYQIKPWEKIYKAITFFGKIFQLANSNEKATMLLAHEGVSHYLTFTWDLA
jgi:hypothetical protein